MAAKEHGLWLIPYADLMSLLLAVALVLLASRVVRNRHESRPEPGLQPTLLLLKKLLQADIAEGRLRLSLEKRGLVVSIKMTGFFSSGSAVVSPQAYRSIVKIAGPLRSLPNAVRLEGYTDARPIHNERFRSNWELSTFRSLAILHILKDLGVSGGRMSISGFADTQARLVVKDASEQDNDRRVDIVILSS